MIQQWKAIVKGRTIFNISGLAGHRLPKYRTNMNNPVTNNGS